MASVRRWSEGITRTAEEKVIQTWAGTSPEGLGSMGTHAGAQEEQGMAQRSCCTLTLNPVLSLLSLMAECDPWLWHQEEWEEPDVMLSLKCLLRSDLSNPLSILVWVLRTNNSRPSSLEKENLDYEVPKPHLNMGIMFMWIQFPFQKITLHVSWSK